MKTLIELYDTRPLENVLSTEVFRPERTVYICPGPVANDKKAQKVLRDYFHHRRIQTELIFLGASLLSVDEIMASMRSAVETFPDCVLDITGGTEAALFAAGKLCSQYPIPVFTYSRKRNAFYNIQNCDFTDGLPCELQYNVEDCFLMAGGDLRPGRVDNSILNQYSDLFEPFFDVFLEYRKDWSQIITYIQRASQVPKGEPITLDVNAADTLKGEHGARVHANRDALHSLERIGMLDNLEFLPENRVAFRFRDAQIRFWLRDVGSVLELYVYKCCQDTGLFQDVRSSSVVGWESGEVTDSVTNELDVMATRGVTPIFISCKACEVKTEALNELAILRDRFGGKGAKAIMVTTERCGASARHRAAQLDIAVIDLEELESGHTAERLKVIMKAEPEKIQNV